MVRINILLVESFQIQISCGCWWGSSADPEGGGGTGGPDPPGKSQVIWVSIGNKQLEPPWKKLDTPPPLEP